MDRIDFMTNNVTALYTVEQIRELEKIAIEKFGISVNVLMERAGKGAFQVLRKQWPQAKNVTVVCGKGNNGGDGYVVAYLAKKARLNVKILQLVPYEALNGAAARAAQKCKKIKIKALPFSAKELEGSEVIVDAILGIGVVGKISGKFKLAIEAINATNTPVLAIDLPSGVNADSGNVLGTAINANITVTFIGLKIGLLIGEARNHTGAIICHDLSLPEKIWQEVDVFAKKLDLMEEIKSLPPRKRTAHKGSFGHVLVIGGDYGMGGAVRMAAEAALRVGAGLVSVATREKNALVINAVCPEIMAHGVNAGKKLHPLLAKASVIILGPGLGTSGWGKSLLNVALKVKKPMVIDADALNILATSRRFKKGNWVLTPHPGEAARLLKTTNQNIQTNRLKAVQSIQRTFGGISVLKGAGTLIAGVNEEIRVCDAGNPGMASAGMGDVLSGIIAGLIAQGLSLGDAANLGVLVHALAGDRLAAKKGMIGILALDLLPEVRRILTEAMGIW